MFWLRRPPPCFAPQQSCHQLIRGLTTKHTLRGSTDVGVTEEATQNVTVESVHNVFSQNVVLSNLRVETHNAERNWRE